MIVSAQKVQSRIITQPSLERAALSIAPRSSVRPTVRLVPTIFSK